MITSRLSRSAATLLAALAIGLTALTGCGGNTDCALDGCRITFARDGQGGDSVSVLGVQARLVGVEGGVATVEVAGNTVALPVGEQAQTDGFTIGVESVTETEVVVRVSGA